MIIFLRAHSDKKKDPLLRVFGFMDKSLPKDFMASKRLQN